MVPPQQRLDAGDGACRELDLRLPHQAQLVGRERALQVRLELGQALQLRAHLRA